MLERLFGTSAQPQLIETAFKDFSEMLQQAAKMLDLALDAVLRNQPLDVDLDKMDDVIDNNERDIRRAVLEHLSLSPNRDLVASLVLISMVQDAERIGDFARGLGDLPELAKSPRNGPFADELEVLAQRVRPMVDTCDAAFRRDDSEMARTVLSSHVNVKADLSAYIARIADSDLDADMAIVYGATARNLQRVSAHLSNIASSVVKPFDRMRHDDDDVA